jgi:hypothetical protein
MIKIIKNEDASINPVIIFFVTLAVASFLILLLGMIIEPFFNLMGFEDDTITESISAPRMTMYELGQIIWPKGVLLVVLLGLIFGLLMEYQKSKYQQG